MPLEGNYPSENVQFPGSDISRGSHVVDAHKGVQKVGEGAFKHDQPL